MRPAPITQIHGFMSPDSAGWKGRNLNLQLMSIDPSRRTQMNFGAAIDQTKGTFEFRQVFPGSYTLVAFSNDGADDKRIGSLQRIEVSDRPLDVVLELHPAFELTGKVELDANSNNNANTGASGNTGVGGSTSGGAQGRAAYSGLNGPGNNRKPSLSQVGIQLIDTPFPTQTQVSEDGSFTLKGVIPGVWRLQVNTPLAFVKSAWMGSVEVTNGPLDLSKGAAGALRIVLNTNTGTIRGSAPAGQTIFAQRIDDDLPFRSNRATQTDPSGQYTLPNLPPGKYRLVPADTGGPMPDEDGQEVTVHEGETVMLDLKAPAGQ